MREPIVVTSGVRVPADAVQLRAVRARGPGGQNVNKVASKVELHVDLTAIEGLSDAERGRLEMQTRRRRDAAGYLLVTSQKTRNQGQNIEDARDKVRRLVLIALRPAVPRRATRPSLAAVERRIAGKKARAETKRWRSMRED